MSPFLCTVMSCAPRVGNNISLRRPEVLCTSASDYFRKDIFTSFVIRAEQGTYRDARLAQASISKYSLCSLLKLTPDDSVRYTQVPLSVKKCRTAHKAGDWSPAQPIVTDEQDSG